MHNQKGQSIAEYVMNYGWAIIIVLLIVAALYSLGAFSGVNLASRIPTGNCKVDRSGLYGNTGPTLSGPCVAGIPQYTLTSVNPIPGSYLIIPNSGIQSANRSFTVAFWVSTTYPNTSQVIISQKNGYAICIGGGGITLSDSPETSYTAPFVFNLGQWYFVTVSYTKEFAQIYVNGTGIGGTPISAWNVSPGMGTLYFTGIKNGTAGNTNVGLTGLLSNVQIYDQPLSQQDDYGLYLSGIGGVPINLNHLTGWWPFNGNLKDYSGYNSTGIAIGNGNNFTSFWTGGYGNP